MVTSSSTQEFSRARPGLLRMDPLLLLATLGLVGASLYVLSMAAPEKASRQVLFVAVGLVLMLVLAHFDYSRLREWKWAIYGFAIVSIVLVRLAGSDARGSRRAIEAGFINFQASELGKLLLVVALSAFVVDRLRRLSSRDTTSRILLLALVPAILVVLQPDLGSALVYLAIVAAILLVAGTPWTHFAALGGLTAAAIAVVVLAAPAMGVQVLHGYQMDRLTAFLHPTSDPTQQGWQVQQSLTAIGAGGKTGRDEATQTELNFLPEHHTDFIFSVVGEEFGFVGAALVLSLFALAIWRALRILTMAKNLYGALVAGGITAMLMFQVFVNVGMTIGIMPITGIPLPLLSYGGSSVITTLMAIGLLQSIHAQARETAGAKGP